MKIFDGYTDKLKERVNNLREESDSLRLKADQLEDKLQNFNQHFSDSENWQLLLNDWEGYENTLVLDYNKIGVFLGLAYDYLDYYYVVDYGKNGGVVWISCVGRLFKLKNRLPEDEYNSLVRIWNLNEQLKAQ